MTTYRYYLPTFVGASAGVTRRRRAARPVCTECVRIVDNAERCSRYLASVDSNGQRYCVGCGHTDTVHPA